jgi:hypothetical protein
MVLMKYQDVTFENAFWTQLKEMHGEWKDCAMVGTMSCSAHRKVRLCQVDREIRLNKHREYFHFLDTKTPLGREKNHHTKTPMVRICNDILSLLKLKPATAAYCNYFMCKPDLMLQFIDWFHGKLRPAVLAHPLSMHPSDYLTGKLSRQELMRLCGRPYYPLVPFIIERLNKCFFHTLAINNMLAQKLKHRTASLIAPMAAPITPPSNYRFVSPTQAAIDVSSLLPLRARSSLVVPAGHEPASKQGKDDDEKEGKDHDGEYDLAAGDVLELNDNGS